MEYAIVDIETTGGNASGSRMTEIAIRIHDGREVVDRYETLINPEKNIPLAIFALTGIDNAMVREAPVFNNIARKVYEMLEGRIFVAHNVNFDYWGSQGHHRTGHQSHFRPASLVSASAPSPAGKSDTPSLS